MKHIKIFFTAIKNNLIALIVFLILWSCFALFFEEYIVPSPLEVFMNSSELINQEFIGNFLQTLYRILVGFSLAFLIGTFLGFLSYFFKIQQTIESTLILFQVLPGTILGIIFLLILGEGSAVPIALIVTLTTPLIAINTGNSLSAKNKNLENMIYSFGGNHLDIVLNLNLPLLIPTMRSNITIGLGFAAKIVILGEFIASEKGLGYLLNVSKVFFDMNAVFFYLFFIILLMLFFQIFVNLFFVIFFEKYLFINQE